jgi:imidazolonepropionase
MSFVIALACIKMKLTPEEAINAATMNTACALEVQDRLGSVTKGKNANLFVTQPIPSLAYIPYSFGATLVDKVILNGNLVA